MPQRKRYYLSSNHLRLKKRIAALKKRPAGRPALFKLLLKGFLITCLFFLIGGAGMFVLMARDLPDPQKINERRVIESTKIFDRTGEILLYDIHGEEKRTVIPFEEIPKYLKDATLSIEDAGFYEHRGLDIRGIARAILKNLTGRKISEGGSTITQQFIKNSILTPEKTFTRKIKEAILSIEIERRYSKDEILGFYLNQIPYGSNAYGIEAAANTFFNKSARDLTLAESAVLAALPKAPSYYYPYGSHPEELTARKNYILDRMTELGFIKGEEAEAAKAEELVFAPKSYNIKAPHFVMFVKEYLEEKYGEEYLEQGGLKVITTLDYNLQQIAEEAVKNGVEKNIKRYKAYNAALTAIDPETGQILAMVGSRDYFADPIPEGCTPGKDCLFEPNVNVAIRERQPGSSFKPFAYATAFKKGYTPNTILFDVETEFASLGAKSYIPHNYDLKFRGPVSMKNALAQSLNVPSVKVLYLAGVNETINTAQDLGITTLKERKRYGLSLVLGGGEVRPLDETAAFGVFATEGIRNPQTPILKIEDAKGKILEEFRHQPEKVLDSNIARLITDILSDNEARSPIFGVQNYLTLGSRPVAAKTGTTQEHRDGWTIGYTPNLVAGVWTGNNNNESMYLGSGAGTAAPIWNEFMKKALAEKPLQYFTKPIIDSTSKPVLDGEFENEIKIKIDKISGKLATEFTPPDLIEERTYKEVHSILYYVTKDDPRGEIPDRPDADPQFNNWESAMLKWALSPERTKEGVVYNEPLPTEYDDIHTEENQPRISIISPGENEIFEREASITIRIELSAKLKIKQVDFFFDDELINIKTNEPYFLIFNIPSRASGRNHTLKARAYDEVGNRGEHEINIKIEGLAEEEESLPPAVPSLGLEISGDDFPYTLRATASNFENEIEKVSFYYSQKNSPISYLIGLATNTPYETLWAKPKSSGNYTIYAFALDKEGNMITSNQITKEVE